MKPILPPPTDLTLAGAAKLRRLWAQYKRQLQAFLDTELALLAAVRRQDQPGQVAIHSLLTVQCDRIKRTEHALDDLLGVPHDEP